MFCLSKRTVLFCCVLVVSLVNVAGREHDTIRILNNTNDELVPAVSSRIDLPHYPLKELLLPKKCGIQNPVDKIHGGAKTDIDEHPWLAMLVYDSGLIPGVQYGCGGSLISERYVLTSANCVNPKAYPVDSYINLTHVILGAWDMSAGLDCPIGEGGCDPPHQDIQIEKTIIHEKYRGGHHLLYDIGLLRLNRDAEFNDWVKPICLPLTNELKSSVKIGEELDVIGWGLTDSYGKMTNIKRKVPVPVISNDKCAEAYGHLKSSAPRKIGKTQLCAGGVGGRDACIGDEGGPLMGMRGKENAWVVFGIVSYGIAPCGAVGWPGVYTRVGSFTDWILSKLEPDFGKIL